MKNLHRNPKIKSFNEAKKCALNDIKRQTKLISKQLVSDNVLFNIVNTTKKKTITNQFDDNFITAKQINKFHQLITT